LIWDELHIECESLREQTNDQRSRFDDERRLLQQRIDGEHQRRGRVQERSRSLEGTNAKLQNELRRERARARIETLEAELDAARAAASRRTDVGRPHDTRRPHTACFREASFLSLALASAGFCACADLPGVSSIVCAVGLAFCC